MSKAKTQTKSDSKPAKALADGHHPKQHLVNVVKTNGDKFQILTTWGKEGDTLRLDADPLNHPAWQENGQSFINVNDERVTKFKKKFGNFDFVGNNSESN